MIVKEVKQKEIIDLRYKVLRPDSPIEDCYFPLDNEKGVFHLAVFEKDTIVCIASFYPEVNSDIKGINPYRLRGMATDPNHRRKGLGKFLIKEAIEHLEVIKSNLLWCNARTSAITFYKAQNFKISGEEFDIPTVGPHFVMYTNI